MLFTLIMTKYSRVINHLLTSTIFLYIVSCCCLVFSIAYQIQTKANRVKGSVHDLPLSLCDNAQGMQLDLAYHMCISYVKFKSTGRHSYEQYPLTWFLHHQQILPVQACCHIIIYNHINILILPLSNSPYVQPWFQLVWTLQRLKTVV